MYFEHLWEKKIPLKYSYNDISHMQPIVGKME